MLKGKRILFGNILPPARVIWLPKKGVYSSTIALRTVSIQWQIVDQRWTSPALRTSSGSVPGRTLEYPRETHRMFHAASRKFPRTAWIVGTVSRIRRTDRQF